MPVGRQDLMRKVYRRYFTLAGKFFPKLVGAEDFTEEVLNDWYSYFHQCSQCRRCSVFCPYGIDTAEISMAAREIMDHIGVGQKYCNEIIAKVYKIGNNLGLPGPALADTLEGLEEDVFDETGVEVKYPLDQEGADILLVTPSADFFAEPHVDGLIGYGKVFHEAGVSWTLSTHASEAANFGMFIGSYENMRRVAMRIREAAIKLKVKRIVFGECGHAWRVAYSFLNTLAGPWDFLDPRYPVPQHICEFTYGLIQEGKLNLDKSRNDDMVLTYHDSCNVARASRMGEKPGGQFDIPRAIIRASVQPLLRHGRGDHPRPHLLLRGRWWIVDRRPDGDPGQGRAAALGGPEQRHAGEGRHAHGRDLRHLQEPIHQGVALLRHGHGPDRQRPPVGVECLDPDRPEQ